MYQLIRPRDTPQKIYEALGIVADYSEEMKNMIEKANPGLKSRFPVWLDFEDYTTAEMAQIFRSMLAEKGYRLAGESQDLTGASRPAGETGEQQDLAAPAGAAGDLAVLIEKASREPGFGNGRGVRNLVEKVIAAQSLRLAAIGYENIRNPEMYVEIQREDLQSVSNSGGKL